MSRKLIRTPEQERRSAAYIADQAARCAELWRAVIVQLALDLEPTWGLSKVERHEAVMFFEGNNRTFRRWREELCALAMIDPEALLIAYADGRLHALSRETIGKRRYETRRRNIMAKTIDDMKLGQQKELFL